MSPFSGILFSSPSLLISLLAGNSDQQEAYNNAKLALLLQLCQSRDGAKHVLQANLMRAIELSGLFAADPELQIGKEENRRSQIRVGPRASFPG